LCLEGGVGGGGEEYGSGDTRPEEKWGADSILSSGEKKSRGSELAPLQDVVERKKKKKEKGSEKAFLLGAGGGERRGGPQ